jgi:ATP synthase protein I
VATDELAAQIMMASPIRVVVWQAVASVVLAIAWAMLRDVNAGWSALAGGAVCFVPSGWFALRLMRASAKQDGYVFAFFAGEGIKVLLSVAMFGLVAISYRDADWLALMVSYIVVLQVYVFGLAGAGGTNPLRGRS